MPTQKRSSGKRWRKAENKLLKKLAEEGLSFTKMVIRGRNSHAITVHARELDITTATTWCDEEIEELKRKVKPGVNLSKIYIRNRITGKRRSSSSVRRIAKSLGLVKKGKARKIWTGFEKQTLTQLYQRGYSAQEIKDEGFFGPDHVDIDGKVLPERELNAISKMAQRLGLADKTKSQAASGAKRLMTPEISKKLDEFIKANCKNHAYKVNCSNIWSKSINR